MPQKLYDDEWTETWQGDNGQVLTVAKPVAQKLFGGMGQDDWTAGHLPPAGVAPEPMGVAGDVPMPPSSTPPGAAPLPPPSPDVPPPDLRPSQLAEGPQPTGRAVEQPAPAGAPSSRGASAGRATLAPDQETTPQQEAYSQQEAAPGLGRAYQRQADAARLAAEAESIGQQRIANAYSLANAEVKNTEDKAAAQRAADEADISNRREAYDKGIKAYNEAQPNRGRWWETRSKGSKFLAVIGAALAGLGSAMKGEGGKNPALDLILGKIDQDVADQQAQIAKQGLVLQMEKGAIDDAIGDAQRRAADYSLQRAQRIDGTKRTIEQIIASTNSEKVKANGMQVLGQLEVEYTKSIADAANKAWERDFRERSFVADERHRASQRAQGWAGLAQRRKEFEAELEAKKAKGEVPTGVLLNPLSGKPMGVSRFGAIDKKETVTDQNQINAYATLREDLAEYHGLLQKAGRIYNGPGGGSSTVRSQIARSIDQKRLALAQKYALLNNPGGRISDADVEMEMKKIPGAQSLTERADPDKLVKNLTRDADQSISVYLKGRGVDPSDLLGTAKQFDDIHSANDAPNTPAEKAYKSAVKSEPVKGSKVPDWLTDVAAGATGSTGAIKALGDEGVRVPAGAITGQGALYETINEKGKGAQEQAVDRLATMAEAGDKQAIRNLETLEMRGGPIGARAARYLKALGAK